MTRKKSHSETEYLRGVVRELKSEIRNLKKQSGNKSKKLKVYENLVVENEIENETVAEEVFSVKKLRCPDCNSDQMDVVDLIIKDLWECEACGFRRTFLKKKA